MSTHRKCVLLVDSDEAFRATVREILVREFRGAQVVEASDGASALFKLERQEFQLLVTDIKLPKMDGLTLIRKLETLPRENRPWDVLVITGEATRDEVVAEIGPVAFLPKPLVGENLVAEARRSLAPEGTVAAGAPLKADASLIEPFILAAVEVLKVTANIAAVKEKVFLRAHDQMSGDISAIIAMNSDDFLGSAAISFEKAAFLAVLEGMLGEKYPDITAENQDACAELCNQIFGSAKKVLNERGHSIQPAIPSVIVGPGHTLKHSARGPCIAVQFRTAHGMFTVEAVAVPRAK